MQEVKEIDQVSKILIESGSIKVGKFLLASGKTSSIYIDMRKILGNPNGFKLIVNLLNKKFYEINNNEKIDVVIGVATGGIAWSSLISYLNDIPMAYVRQPKGHGTDSKIEGADVENKNCLIIDDVSTTGGSIINSINLVRNQKGIVRYSMVIVDRGEGAVNNLKEIGVNLYYVFSLKEILKSLLNQGLISEQAYKSIVFELYGE